jgi:elongation factor P--(R)-beta-lysine ligase
MIFLSHDELLRRHELKAQLRAYLAKNGLIELDVPCLAKNACPDSAVAPIPVQVDGQHCFLQPSPEILMKRLLATHAIDCYHIGPAFRADPISPIHNPEFLMLEFYLIGQRYAELKQKTIDCF